MISCNLVRTFKHLKIVFVFIILTAPLELISRSSQWKEINSSLYRVLFNCRSLKEVERLSRYINTTLHTIHSTSFRNISTNQNDLFFSPSPMIIDFESLEFNGIANPSALYHSAIYINSDSYQHSATVSPHLKTIIHEMRHMAQFQLNYQANLWNQVWYWFSGQTLGYIQSTIQLPPWYFEGEAVLWETLFTREGRGRIPYFDLFFRTRLLEEKNPRTDFYGLPFGNGLPPLSDYVLGYFLITYFMKNYPEDVIQKIIKKKGTYFGLFPTISSSIEEITGKEFDQHYLALKKELTTIWRHQQTNHLPFTQVEEILSPPDNHWWYSYNSPRFDQDGNLYYVYSSYGENHPPTLYQRSSNRLNQLPTTLEDQKIISPFKKRVSDQNQMGFSVGKNLLVWSEKYYPLSGRLSSSIRSYQSGRVKILDLLNSDQITLGDSSTKYHNALISDDDSLLLILNRRIDNYNQLEIWQPRNRTWKKTKSIPIKESILGWDLDLKKENIVLTLGASFDQDRNQLILLNWRTEKRKILIPPTYQERLSHPVFWKEWIIHHSDYSGIDNIYAVHTNHLNRYRITSRPFGALKPVVSPDQKYLYFEDYTARGFQIAKIPLHENPPIGTALKTASNRPTIPPKIESSWKPFKEILPSRTEYFSPLLTKMKPPLYETERISNRSISNPPPVITDYRLSKQELLPHSWSFYPLYDDKSRSFNYLNLGLNFNNLFSTSIIGLNYTLSPFQISIPQGKKIYTQSTLLHSFSLAYIFKGIHPILSLRVRYVFFKNASFKIKISDKKWFQYQPKNGYDYIYYLLINPTIIIPFNFSSELLNFKLEFLYQFLFKYPFLDRNKIQLINRYGIKFDFGETHWKGSWRINHSFQSSLGDSTKLPMVIYSGLNFNLPGFLNFDRFNLNLETEWLTKLKNISLSKILTTRTHSYQLEEGDQLILFFRSSYSPLVHEVKPIPFISTYSLDQFIELSFIYEHLFLLNLNQKQNYSQFIQPGMGFYFKIKKRNTNYFKIGAEFVYQPLRRSTIEPRFILLIQNISGI